MTTTPALVIAAAGVGFGHAVLPDHWAPLAVLARTRRYPPRRVVRLSLLAGVAHVLLSILLGGILIAVGLQFRSTVQRHEDLVVGGLLLVTGLALAVAQLTGRGHGHDHDSHDHDSHDHDHGHDHDLDSHDHVGAHGAGSRERGPVGRLAAVVVPFGAAASPDLTILPVFVAASGVSVLAAASTLVAFAVVTVATIVGATSLAAAGVRQLRASWIDAAANTITAGVLIVIGTLVVAGVL